MSGELDLSDLPDDPTEFMFVMPDESGGEWRPVDNALMSLDGSARSLPQAGSRDTYSFSWGAFPHHMGIYST